jgi:hypothetical protein
VADCAWTTDSRKPIQGGEAHHDRAGNEERPSKATRVQPFHRHRRADEQPDAGQQGNEDDSLLP